MIHKEFIPLTRSKYGMIFWSLFSFDGKMIFFGGDSSNIGVWNFKESTLNDIITTNSKIILSAAQHPAQEQLAISHTERSIQIWNTVTKEKIRDVQQHRQSIKNLHYIKNGSLLVSSADKSVSVRDVVSDKRAKHRKQFKFEILKLSASENSSCFGVTHSGGVEVWSLNSESLLHIDGLYTHGGKGQSGIIVSKDGGRVWVSFRTSPSLCLWEIGNNNLNNVEAMKLKELFPDDSFNNYYDQVHIPSPTRCIKLDGVYNIAISHNEETLALGLRDEIVLVHSESLHIINRWHVPLGNEKYRSGTVGQLSFSFDDKFLISVLTSPSNEAGGVWVWSV